MTRLQFTDERDACVYVARDTDIALAIEVHDTTIGPLALHVGFPFEPEGEGAQPHPCEWVDGGRCYGNVIWFSYADDVWERCRGKLHTFDQGDLFWERFGWELAAQAQEYRDRAAACIGWGI